MVSIYIDECMYRIESTGLLRRFARKVTSKHEPFRIMDVKEKICSARESDFLFLIGRKIY